MKNNIKEHRILVGLTQLELANKASVTRQTVNAIENEKYAPSLELAFDLAKILNVTVDELFVRNK